MEYQSGRGMQHKREFINKVAEKLGMAPEKVAAAMREARKERVDQAVAEKIQRAVQDGVISQTEASQNRDWWKNRPEGLQKLFMGHAHGHGFGRGWIKGLQK
jgi:uncharacterized protein (DUF2267 family)